MSYLVQCNCTAVRAQTFELSQLILILGFSPIPQSNFLSCCEATPEHNANTTILDGIIGVTWMLGCIWSKHFYLRQNVSKSLFSGLPLCWPFSEVTSFCPPSLKIHISEALMVLLVHAQVLLFQPFISATPSFS